MEVITHDRVGMHLDSKVFAEMHEAIDKPLLSMFEVPSSDMIVTT